MNNENLDIIRRKLRRRLTEYRYVKLEKETSVHVSAIDMALCLTDYLCEKNRSILKSERKWFNAEWELIHVLENSEWEDLLSMYFELKSELEKSLYI